jgi:hypothetical protein
MSIENDILGKNAEEFLPLLERSFLENPNWYCLTEIEHGLNRKYIEFHNSGINIVIDENDNAFCLQLFSKYAEPDEYQQYIGPLIFGLTFDSNRDATLKVMGVPIRSSNSSTGASLVDGGGLPWDLFRTEQWDVNITYSEDLNSINFVSVSLHDDRIAFGDSAVN